MNMLLEVQNDFITTVFPIVRYVLFFLIIASAIVIIVSIMMQKESDSGMGALTGDTKQESYYSQNKGSTREGKLKKLTIVMSIVIACSVLIYFITELFNMTK